MCACQLERLLRTCGVFLGVPAMAAEPLLAPSARRRRLPLAGALRMGQAASAGAAAAVAVGLVGGEAGETAGWRGVPSPSARDPTSAPPLARDINMRAVTVLILADGFTRMLHGLCDGS